MIIYVHVFKCTFVINTDQSVNFFQMDTSFNDLSVEREEENFNRVKKNEEKLADREK